MNFHLIRAFLFLRCVFPVLLALSSPVHAQNAATKDTSGFKPFPNNKPLVISKGVIQDGRNTPATVQNLVGLIREIYRGANVTVLGVDAVVVGDLTLQWQGHRAPESQEWVNPPLNGVLTTLCLASGRKFMVSSFGPNDFLLRPLENDDDNPSTRRTTEVFSLSTLMGAERNKPDSPLRLAQAELAVLQKRYGDNHPRVMEASDRVDVLKALYPPVSGGLPVAKALIELIEDVVVTTQRAKSNGDVPEFKYHPNANLLVVIGSGDAIDVTRKVIAALEKYP